MGVLTFHFVTVCCLFRQQQERDDSNLYIANLPLHTSEKDLEMMFANFGAVVSTRILRAPNGISRGVGFVRMDSKLVCEAVIDAFNNKLLPGLCSLDIVHDLWVSHIYEESPV